MAQEILRKLLFEHFGALSAKRPQKAIRRIILSIFGPWAPNGSRKPSEDSFRAFSDLGRQLAQEALSQVAFRMLILSIFEPSVPNDPGGSQKANFEHFRALSAQRPQEAVRSAF